MASNVFGNPITDSTLQGMRKYAGKTTRRTDRAQLALNMKNAQNKDTNAWTYVENLINEYGDGVSTLCLVYNATGDTVTFVTNYNWSGHIGNSPFPVQIKNGQWGAFLHVHDAGAAAFVVYRGKNEAGDECDWMLAWTNSYNGTIFPNNAYTEIREKGHYEKTGQEAFILYDNMINKLACDSGVHNSDNWNGCLSDVSTGQGTTAVFEAIMTLQDA